MVGRAFLHFLGNASGGCRDKEDRDEIRCQSLRCNYHIKHCTGLIEQYGFHTHYSVGFKIAIDPTHPIIFYCLFVYIMLHLLLVCTT